MIRLIGGLMITMSLSLLGFQAARSLDEEYREMEELRKILISIKSEMQYGRSFLAETFLSVSEMQEEPYAGWFRNMYELMSSRKPGTLASIWKNSASACLKDLSLREREKKRLYELGRYLGQTDLEGQIRHLDLYAEHLETEMENRRMEMQPLKKLYRVLGVTAGIFLTILLI